LSPGRQGIPTTKILSLIFIRLEKTKLTVGKLEYSL